MPNQPTLDEARLQREYKFLKVGEIFQNKKEFIIKLDDEWCNIDKVVYAFALGGQVVRIGATKRALYKRMKDWERCVSKAFCGDYRYTREHEKEKWEEYLSKNSRKGSLFARQGHMVKTPIGKINAYLAEESELISRYDLPMNNSTFR